MDYPNRLHLVKIRTSDAMEWIELQHERASVAVPALRDVGERTYRLLQQQVIADIEGLVLALNRLRRDVTYPLDKDEIPKPGDLPEALENFNAATPWLKFLRDILEHRDEYDRGEGRFENRLDHGRHVGMTYNGTLTITYKGVDVRLTDAVSAARHLYAEVVQTLQANGERVDLRFWPRAAQALNP